MSILDAAGGSTNTPAEQTPAPIDDGGPAFPMQFLKGSDQGLEDAGEQFGMSVRALAAVHALEGLLAGWQEGDAGAILARLKSGETVHDYLAHSAVAYADALVARLKQGGKP